MTLHARLSGPVVEAMRGRTAAHVHPRPEGGAAVDVAVTNEAADGPGPVPGGTAVVIEASGAAAGRA